MPSLVRNVNQAASQYASGNIQDLFSHSSQTLLPETVNDKNLWICPLTAT